MYYAKNVGLGNTTLWVSDGSEAGTQFVGLGPIGFSRIIGDMKIAGNTLYFDASGSLWKTGGTASSTVRVAQFSRIGELTVFNSTLFFSGPANFGPSTQLWKSNGDISNTVPVQGDPLLPEPDYFGFRPDNLTVLGDRLIYSASSDVSGATLWISDGSIGGTRRINTDAPAPNTQFSTFTVLGDTLYFAANNGINGLEPWKTDGTSSGTVLAGNINPEGVFENGSNPFTMIAVGDTLYISAVDDVHGRELWKISETDSPPNSDNELCLPIKTSDGRVAVVCL